MRARILLAIILASGLMGFGQTATTPPPGLPKDARAIFAAAAPQGSPTDPRAILDAAAPFYDFSDPTLKPFHIKATYQLYDESGQPEERGTWDYWHVTSKEYRSSWVRADATRTDWQTADGAVHRKESGKPLRYFERSLADSLFFPLPTKVMLGSGRSRIEFQNVPVGGQSLSCVVFFQQPTIGGRQQAPPPSATSRYCFEPSTHALLVSVLTEVGTEYRQIVRMQNHYLPREMDFFVGRVKLFTVSIDAISAVPEADPAMTPATDSVLVSPPVTKPEAEGSAGSLAIGALTKKYPPDYPLFAKMNGVQGKVVLAAVIGKDGRIGDLEVLASPSPLLSKSALDAVKRWEYRPYLLNGEPVEVETTINVIFSLGQ